MSTDPREFEHPIDGSATPAPEAIEAASRALFEEMQELDQDNSWDDPLPDEWRESWRDAAREAIEAASPFIVAQALRDAVSDFESNVGVAEFDEQTRRDGLHHTHAYEAWDHQSAYMDWLRNRADQIEGKDS